MPTERKRMEKPCQHLYCNTALNAHTEKFTKTNGLDRVTEAACRLEEASHAIQTNLHRWKRLYLITVFPAHTAFFTAKNSFRWSAKVCPRLARRIG